MLKNLEIPNTIMLAGEPMSGNSTFLRAIAYVLDGIIISGSLRNIAAALSHPDKGPEFDNGFLIRCQKVLNVDRYIDQENIILQRKLISEGKLVIWEGKPLARFRLYLEKKLNPEIKLGETYDLGEKSYAIYLKCDDNARSQRAMKNGRKDDLKNAKTRMIADSERYKLVYGYDPHDPENIRNWNDLVFETDGFLGDRLEILFKKIGIILTHEMLDRFKNVSESYKLGDQVGNEFLKKATENLYYDKTYVASMVVNRLTDVEKSYLLTGI